MTDFLGSLKADLLDRRILPILVLLGVALVGALAYAVLGGGGSTATATGQVSPAPATAISAFGHRRQRRHRRARPAGRRDDEWIHASQRRALRATVCALPGPAATTAASSTTPAGTSTPRPSTTGSDLRVVPLGVVPRVIRPGLESESGLHSQGAGGTAPGSEIVPEQAQEADRLPRGGAVRRGAGGLSVAQPDADTV